MTSYAEARWLPRGWAHLALQFAVWFGFYGAYQAVRGAADRSIAEAFWNGTLVIEAGMHDQSVRLRSEDLVALSHGEVADIRED